MEASGLQWVESGVFGEIPGEPRKIGVGIFQPLDWPEPEIAYSLDRSVLATGLRDRSRGGGTRLVIQALSGAPGCKFHSTR